jgi:hypothetical protein
LATSAINTHTNNISYALLLLLLLLLLPPPP